LDYPDESPKAPNLPDDRVDAWVHSTKTSGPTPLDNVSSAHELPSTLDQQHEQIHRPPLDLDRAALKAQLVSGDVEVEVTKSERLTRPGCGQHG
jgi:hypothetical protein